MGNKQALAEKEQDEHVDRSKWGLEEKLTYAKERNILDVAEALGIELQRKGRIIMGVEHDSMVMYPNTNTFKWFSQDIGGDVISFVQTFSDKSFKEAIDYLNTADLTEASIVYKEPEKKPFYYYVKESDDFSLAKDYLVNERKINESIIDHLHDQGYLSQGQYMPQYPESDRLAPCVVAKWEKENKLVGGTIQGLELDYELYGKRGRDKKIMANVESNYGFNYTIGKPNKVVFAESFIDVLSYWSLHPELDNCLLVDLEGLKSNTVEKFMATLINDKGGSIEEGIIVAVDNDAAGQKFVDKLSKYSFTDLPMYQLVMPDHLSVTTSHMGIYQEVATKLNIDPLAIAAVHKAYTNGSSTNELANPWRNDQFYGKYLSSDEKPQLIDVSLESQIVGEALAKVKRPDNTYDFKALTANETKEPGKMATKLDGIYGAYVTKGVTVKDVLLEDMNDVLKESKALITEELPTQLVVPDKEGKEEAHSHQQTNQTTILEESETKKMEVTERLSTIKEAIQADQTHFETTMVNLPPLEIMAQSETIVQRNMVVTRLTEWLDEVDPTFSEDLDFLTVLESIDLPVTASVEVVNTTPEMAVNADVFASEFPQLLRESLQDATPMHSFELPEEVQATLSLLAESLSQELTDYDVNLGDTVKDMRLTLQMDYLKSVLLDASLLAQDDRHLMPGNVLENFSKESKEHQLVASVLTNASQSPAQMAVTVNEIMQGFTRTPQPTVSVEHALDVFKEWANTYDGIGEDYVPLAEINQLELLDNSLYLEAATTWFETVEDYLQTHKETNFGLSSAYTNAQLLLSEMDNPNRELLVTHDKVKVLGTSLIESSTDKNYQELATKYMDKTTLSWARHEEGSWTLIPSPDWSQAESGELLPVIVVDHGERKDARVFDTFSDYRSYSQAYLKEETKQLVIGKQAEELNQQLATLKTWAKDYEGLDNELIPHPEIDSLHVTFEGSKAAPTSVVITDVVKGGYNRQYADVHSFLNSFEGNVWHETLSHQSAVAYVSAQGEPDKQRHELTRQRVLAFKEKAYRVENPTPEQLAEATVWETISVRDYDEWHHSSNKQLITYQDPTRVGNPIYFDTYEQATTFVSKLVSQETQKDEEKSNEKEGASRSFFRRERRDKVEAPITKDDTQTVNNSQVSLPIPGAPTLEDRNDLQAHSLATEKKKETSVPTMSSKPVKETATTKDLIEQARQGAKDFLTSDKYKHYLDTMSRFHNYSWSNTMLILQQMPNAKVVAGFQTWKKQFNRHVTKGQKGIKILAPVFTKQTQTKVKQVDGKKREVEEEVMIQRYKQTTVFDVSQTDGEPLPTLVTELQGNVTNYSHLFEAIASTTDYTIEFEDMKNGAKGYCHFKDQRIAIKTGMSEIQTIKTLVHEITHSHLHDPNLDKKQDLKTMEVEAESTAFAVCSHFGIDTSDYSFGYLATWGSTKEVKEITQSFATIQKQTDKLITTIHSGLEALTKEQSKEQTVSGKLEQAREHSKEFNAGTKKSQAKTPPRTKQKPEKEK